LVLNLYSKAIFQTKTNLYNILVEASSSARMPLGFSKASIKPWKNYGCFSCGPLQGVTPSSLIN